MLASANDEMTRSDIEAMLGQILVPVEPDRDFVKRLKAKLVRYQGDGIPTVWAVVAGFGIGLLVLVALFGVALRIFLGLLSRLGLLERRPTSGREGQASVA